MRKKGENSVKGAGKSAFPPDENNDFTVGGRKSTLLGLVAFDFKHLDGVEDCLYRGSENGEERSLGRENCNSNAVAVRHVQRTNEEQSRAQNR
jgi:hypothetical protein